MIAFLEGRLAATEPGERSAVILNVQGVGYRIKVPERVLKTLPALGEIHQLHTHLVVRETEMILYGFPSAAERDLFTELIKVSGIGPALGLALLNTLSLSELVQAIVSDNTRVLALTPGVGAKTAQRLALELRAKLAHWRRDTADLPGGSGGPPAALQEDVEMALLALGYRPQEIAQVLQMLARQGQLSTTEEWLRAAIAHLSQAP